jgi:hypothetical protein
MFKDTAGKEWKFAFSGDSLKWKLSDAGTGGILPRKYTATFIQTSYARSFIARC